MTGFNGQKVSFSAYDPVYVPSVPSEARTEYGTATVGPGVEFPNTAALSTGNNPPGIYNLANSVDITARTITIQFPVSAAGASVGPGSFDGYVITLLDKYAPRILGAHILQTNISGLTDANVSYSYNHVVGNGSGLTLPSDQEAYIKLGVQFEHSVDVQANDDGTHTITGLDNNQQINSRWYDTMTGGGVHESFVFKPHFGQDIITDFIVDGRQHDQISLSNTDFSTFAQVLSHTHDDASGDAVIAATAGDSITLQGVTKAELKSHPSDFAFHP